MRRADAERPDSNAVDPVGVEGGLDDRCRLARVEPPRPEQQHARVRQPPKREPERARRRGVEPLEIVDRHDEPVLGEQLQGVAERDPERPRIDRTTAGVLDQERDLECPALRRRGGRAGRRRALHRRDRRGRRARGRALTRPGARRARATNARRAASTAARPERRLSDPRVALEHERGRARRDCPPVEERRQRPEVFISADDVDCHVVPSTIVTRCVRKVRCAKRERCRRPARDQGRRRRRRRRRAAAHHGHRACSQRAFRVCRGR